MKEEDIGTYTIRAVDDPRTLNKVLYLKPPRNIYSMNELVALWEKKIGKLLEKVYVPEEKLLDDIIGQFSYFSTFSGSLLKLSMILMIQYILFCSDSISR